MREATSTHVTSPVSCARLIPAKNDPKPSAATQREPDRGPVGAILRGVGFLASREASMTPSIASAIPASCTIRGRSPDASPTSTGIAAPVAESGATMLIVPIASAR